MNITTGEAVLKLKELLLVLKVKTPAELVDLSPLLKQEVLQLMVDVEVALNAPQI